MVLSQPERARDIARNSLLESGFANRSDRLSSRGEPLLQADASIHSCQVTILTTAFHTCRASDRPAAEPAWEGYVRGHLGGTLFHSLDWRDAVASAFGHRPFYLAAFLEGRVTGALPLFLVRSRLAGRMLVSVPYGVGGGILADDDLTRDALFARAVELAGEHRCRCIDLRSEWAEVPGVPIVERYVGFRRELPDRPEDVLAWLPRKARAAARNGRDKFGLSVSFGPEHLSEVWRLYSINMRRLGSICYPFRFFQALAVGMPDRTHVSLIRHEGAPVAGLISFRHADTVLPYFFGATPTAARCSAANFAYFTLAEHAVREGCRVFDFGRTRRDNAGSCDFKRFHGFEPRPLGYQCFALPGHRPANLSPSNPTFSFARRLWPRLPLWLTRAAGARLAKHIPG